MTPLAFSAENALEILPDAYRRALTDEARKAAELGLFPRTDFGESATYWDGVVNEHKRILWMEAYEKRKARLARIAERAMNNGSAAGSSERVPGSPEVASCNAMPRNPRSVLGMGEAASTNGALDDIGGSR